ncbi:MAG: hypothetical protein DHS80DRAFT_33354 [Piptocephalis tieghemiana]|nr:MAG: hypothetical protein DHS80DRAFT_33354 [Piptocephalis tieghemiana]
MDNASLPAPETSSVITPSLVTVVEKRGIREVNPRTQVYHAVHPYLTQAIHYTLLKFKDMAFVWFGSSAGGLKSMTAAMPMPTIREKAVSTSLLSADMEDPCPVIAKRLSARYEQPIYLSSDLFPSTDPDLRIFAERHLASFIKQHLGK